MHNLKKIVVNASPIIVLFKSGLQQILPELFDTIVVPEQVIDEIRAGSDALSKEILIYDWLDIEKVALNENILEWNLGKGETAVISYALKKKDFRAVIDDKAARKCAKTSSVKILGTGHLIVLGVKHGLIEDFDTVFKELKKSGFYISDKLYQILKSKI
jgi:predicted nucleic acid-binding protein